MCYLPPSTKQIRPLEVQVPSMAGIKIPTLKLYRTKIYPISSLKDAWPEARRQPIPLQIDIEIVPPRLPPVSLDLLPHDIFGRPSTSEMVMPTLLSTSARNATPPPLVSGSLPFSSPDGLYTGRPSIPSNIAMPAIEPPTLYTMPPAPPSPMLQDEEISDNVDDAVELDEEEINPEDAWNLVPYHIPWGSLYHGYKSGTLPGPDGKCIFLRSPTPLKNQRTGQACEKCRERKAKCSGTRPSCARCIARGHECEYGPEIKRPRASDAVKEENDEALQLASGSSSAVHSRQNSTLPASSPERVRTATGRVRSNTESVRSKTPTIPSSPACRRRNTVMASPYKKRRASVLEKLNTGQPSPHVASPSFSLGLFSTTSGSAEGETEDSVFDHDTPSTSSDSSEPESYQSFSSQALSFCTMHQANDLSPEALRELSHVHFSELTSDPSYTYSETSPSNLYSGDNLIMCLPDSSAFDNSVKRPYSPISNSYTTPSFPYQHCFPTEAEHTLTYNVDGYPTHPTVDGDDGDDIELDLTTLSTAVTSTIDRWRTASNDLTSSGFSSSRTLSGDGSVIYSHPSETSELSTYVIPEQQLDPVELAYLDALKIQNTQTEYGYEDAHSFDWRMSSEPIPMSMVSNASERSVVRGPGIYFDGNGGLHM